ncbi:MAG: hypothetical protein L0H74_15275, partial [Brachybacterium sp.]|nr:hypothetical protein [Brachybacterium sp.]
ALEDLLAQIDAADRDVTPEHRAAADRIADAFTAARYAAPLPEEGAVQPATTSRPFRPSPDRAAQAAHPLRQDADQIIELIRSTR